MDRQAIVQQVEDVAGLSIGTLAALALAALGGVALAVIAWRILMTRRRSRPLLRLDLRIDLAELGDGGPPAGEAALLLYNLPVRLAAIVLAPVGTGRELPPTEQFGEVFDSIVPFLSQVVAGHRARIRRWPHQLSPRGFAHQFFANVQLPGEAGKGTPWSAVAGVFKVAGQPMMAGLVLRAASDNYIGQTTCETETKWLDVLRVQPHP